VGPWAALRLTIAAWLIESWIVAAVFGLIAIGFMVDDWLTHESESRHR
jgi:hypothetical protein